MYTYLFGTGTMGVGGWVKIARNIIIKCVADCLTNNNQHCIQIITDHIANHHEKNTETQACKGQWQAQAND